MEFPTLSFVAAQCETQLQETPVKRLSVHTDVIVTAIFYCIQWTVWDLMSLSQSHHVYKYITLNPTQPTCCDK